MIPATQRKLDQTRVNLGQLQVSTRRIPLDQEDVERQLGNFLSAAYSVIDVLKDEIGKQWVDRWLSKRCVEDQALCRFMREQRRVELHRRGAVLRQEQMMIPYWEYVSREEAGRRTRGHPAYYGLTMSSGPFGLAGAPHEHPIDILTLGGEELVERCTRYLRLLEEMVQALRAAHS